MHISKNEIKYREFGGESKIICWIKKKGKDLLSAHSVASRSLKNLQIMPIISCSRRIWNLFGFFISKTWNALKTRHDLYAVVFKKKQKAVDINSLSKIAQSSGRIFIFHKFRIIVVRKS